LFSAWGVCAGLLVHVAFAALGLSAILAGSVLAFSLVKYVGAAYLIYLGVRMILDRGSLSVTGTEPEVTTSLRRVFLQGMASNVLNPKVALFFLAFLPQFVGAGSSAAHLSFLLLGLLFTSLGLVLMTLLALFCGTVGEWLRNRPRAARVIGRAAGGVLVGLGVRLALTDSR
jgi:threonine/homoserine/homoserine lactone efflux protein